MIVGYARISTKDQNIDLQIDALQKKGCERIFSDENTYATKKRPGLEEALSILKENDTLVVWKLDRLGRSTSSLVDLIEELHNKGINLCSLTERIDTKSPIGKFLFTVMAALAEMEKALMRERTMAGLEAARKRGRVGGRKRQMTDKKIESAKKMLSQGKTPKQVAKKLKVSVPTLYRWIPANHIS